MNILLISFFSILFLAFFLLPIPIIFFLRFNFNRKLKNINSSFLTFDDGPNPYLTPKILSILDRYQVKATFFVLGENVENNHEILESILLNGHEIGNHGYTHIYPWKPWINSPIKVLKNIIKGENILKQYKHFENSVIYRPNFGKLDLLSLFYCYIKRIPLIFWNIDPKDYNQNESTIISSFVIDRLSPGSVILLHDGKKITDITADALEDILQYSKEKGIIFTTISESFK
jgi:peptidoglycan-N-acetylglucosamine deacetylase